MEEKPYNMDKNGIRILNKPGDDMFDFFDEKVYDDSEVEEMVKKSNIQRGTRNNNGNKTI